MRMEREEEGLLPDDPLRRPGDLFFPAWAGGLPVALDFAVTSPLRGAVLRDAAETTLASAEAYAESKLSDRDTAARCARQGIRLVPMVVEALGGWCKDAQAVMGQLASAHAATSGVHVGIATSRLYENVAVKLQKANAKAILSRCDFSCDDCFATANATLSTIEAARVASAALAAQEGA